VGVAADIHVDDPGRTGVTEGQQQGCGERAK
jgi:hypothetical protein